MNEQAYNENNKIRRKQMKLKILVADDDRVLRELICDILKAHDYDPVPVCNGQEALDVFLADPQINLIILDVLMPKADGWEVLKTIRSESDVPVLMLTALGDEAHEIKGLKNGANDYVSKPFSLDVLISRVEVLLRKTRQLIQNIIRIDGLTMDLLQDKVWVEGTEIVLNHKEYSLLIYLVENRNLVFSRNKLLNDIWGFDYEGDLRNVDTHVKMLRAKLGNYAYLIKTVRGSGYMMEIRDENHHQG